MDNKQFDEQKRKKCPICGDTGFTNLFEQRFALIEGVTFIDEYTVVACDNCGFIYASGVPVQEKLDKYFEKSQKAAEFQMEISDKQRNEYENTWSFITSQFQENKDLSIVDVGCATGDFLFYLKKRGINKLLGIDPLKNCVEFMSKTRALYAIQATISQIDIKEKFDVVKLTMVLEHVEDLKGTILKLKQIVKSEGVLFITVPMLNQFYRSVKLPFKEFSVEHINYFTLKSLNNLMESCGFRMTAYNDRIEPELGIEVMYSVQDKDQRLGVCVDSEAKDLILRYVENCTREEDDKNRRLKNYINNQIPVIVWGAGTFTQRQLKCGDLRKCNIQAIVDKNTTYQGGTYNGIKIISPAQLLHYHGDIIISVYNSSEQIIRYIRDELKLVDIKIISLCENI